MSEASATKREPRRPRGERAQSLCSEPAICRADDRGLGRLHRRAGDSAVSQPSTAGDLVRIALAVLQPARRAPRFNRRDPSHVCGPPAVRPSLRRGGSVRRPRGSPDLRHDHPRPAGALCAVSAVPCAVGFSAFAFERSARESRMRSSVPELGTDALLAGGSSFYQRHTALTLIAALLVGAPLGGEN